MDGWMDGWMNGWMDGWMDGCMHACATLIMVLAVCMLQPQAYEGLRTATNLTEQYLFIPARVKDVYLAHLLAIELPARKVCDSVLRPFFAGCYKLAVLVRASACLKKLP
jgi:hypothetical protein